MIVRLYRLILKLCPREFRERFGGEFLATAEAAAGDNRRSWRQLSDAVRLAAVIRRDVRRDRVDRASAFRGWPHDLRVAGRILRKEPRFAALVIGILAVAIGATTTLFGLIDRLVVKGPDGISQSARVSRVELFVQPPGRPPVTTPTMGHVLFAAIRDQASTIDGAASYVVNDGTLGRGAEARPLRVGSASPEFFRVLGAGTSAGRALDKRDADADPASAPIVISYGFWQRHFDMSSAAVGQTALVDGVVRVIVGITARGFTGAELGPVDVWQPMSVLNPRVTPNWQTAWNAQWLHTVVRAKEGVSLDTVGADLTSVLRSRYDGPSAVMKSAQVRVVPLSVARDRDQAADARVLTWLTGVAALVFIVACANVMSLMLARGWARRREIAVRLAMGASRVAIVRTFLAESAVLAVVGACAGLALSMLLGQLARQAFFESIEWTASPVSLRVVAVAALVALVATLVTGLIPALSARGVDLQGVLRASSRDGGQRRSRLRNALTVAEAAASVVLLIGAGLFVRSFWNARAIDLGVEADRVLVVAVALEPLGQFPEGPARDAERQRRRGILRDSLDAIRTMPGVERASIAVGMPFGFQFGMPVVAPGSAAPEGASRSLSAVTDGYFETVGTKIIEGRAFDGKDRDGSAPVAIVSERLAVEWWPGRSAVGQCIHVGDGSPCARIVGVAGNTHRQRLREAPVSHVYLPAGQERGFGGEVLLVRTRGAAGDDVEVQSALRGRLTTLDASITAVTVEVLQSRLDPELRAWSLGATVFVYAGVLALLVAAAGFYSVLSYTVAARQHEIGVRLALGAASPHVAGVIVRSSLIMALAGVAIGLVTAAVLATRIEPFLFDVTPRNPLVYATVALVLTCVAAAASLGPALRAARIDPLIVLRED